MSSELTDFLTHRRGRIPPQSAGLNRSKTRRTKGLTREDMAELTGVSFKWYTLFESGASKGVSRKLAERVATVLALSAEETHYLLGLLGFADSFTTVPPTGETEVLVRLMHRMSVAAALYSPVLDVLDANTRFQALFPPQTGTSRFASNLVWRLFFDDTYRAAWIDWDGVVRRTVADFKTLTAYVRDSSDYIALRQELDSHPAFGAIWESDSSYPASNSNNRFELLTPSGERVELEPLVLRSLAVPGIHLGTMTVISTGAA